MSNLSNTSLRLVLQYLEDLACPISLSVAIQLRHGAYEDVAARSVRPESFNSAEDYYRAASAVAILKKFQGLGDAEMTRKRAVDVWFEAEKHCYRSNQRLYPYFPGLNLEKDARIATALSAMRKIVVDWIGVGPSPILDGRYGPGATYADRGAFSTVPHKMSSDPTLTRGALFYLVPFLGTAWGKEVAASCELQWVRGNRFTTVPKTSVIDRCIGVEPSINVFYQLEVGRQLRSRLKRCGWDLDYAQDIHREVAQRASVSMEFSTIDLTSASDMVAKNLVKLLLPHRWFDVMNDLRSPTSSHPNDPKRVVLLEKFSSMGNGYTFELETVIFAAVACWATRECGFPGHLGKDVFVFGDDIICRTEVYPTLVAALKFLGFVPNESKSFTGMHPFRESCGGDYFLGVPVRPIYLKKEPCDVKATIGVCNRLRQGLKKLAEMGATVSLRSWYAAVQAVPTRYRNFGPEGLGDAVIHHSNIERWRVRWKDSIRYVKGCKAGNLAVVPFSRFRPGVVLACAVYGVGNVGTPEGGRIPKDEGVTPRDPIRSYVVGWLAYS